MDTKTKKEQSEISVIDASVSKTREATTSDGSKAVLLDYEQRSSSDTALSGLELEWTYGYNTHLSGGVIDLSTSTSEHSIAYVAGHSGVIYNYKTGRQSLLQGHCAAITSISASRNKTLLCTGERATSNRQQQHEQQNIEEQLVIVWEVATACPIRTYAIDEEWGGIEALDISSNGAYIAAILMNSQCNVQRLVIWDTRLTKLSQQPVALHVIEHRDLNLGVDHINQHSSGEKSSHHEVKRDNHFCVRFNPMDETDIVTNGARTIMFWNWKNNKLECLHPSKGMSKLQQIVGNMTVSRHFPYRTEVISATNQGDIVLWDYQSSTSANASACRDAIKTLRLCKHGIPTIEVVEQFLVAGGDDGSIRFFDFQFRILGWFEDIRAGPITSIGFRYNESSVDEENNGGDELRVPDFVVGTSHGNIVRMDAETMSKLPDKNTNRGFLIVKGYRDTILSLDTHMNQPFLLLGSANGLVQIVNYEDKTIIRERTFDKCVTCVKFIAQGNSLVVGMADGKVLVLSVPQLHDMQMFDNSRGSIQMITTSSDYNYFAVCDSNNNVMLYRWFYQDEDEKRPIEWIYIGKYHSHYKPIVSLAFIDDRSQSKMKLISSKHPIRLYSLSQDRVLQAYDVLTSSIRQGIKLHKTIKVEQSSIPTCMFVMPPHLIDENDGAIGIVNDEFKIKTWSTKSDMSQCICTALGPVYGYPMNRVIPLTRYDQDSILTPTSYAFYTTNECSVGLTKLPLDGNKSKSTAILAHPGKISSVAASFDGRFIFTSGADDYVINTWSPRLQHLEASIAYGGERNEPYIEAIGGLDGPIYKEIVDFFCYGQLRAQGNVMMKERKIGTLLPVGQIVDVMRALGYYPTEFDANTLLNQVRLLHDREPKHINIDEFIKLFVNYRPVKEVRLSDIQNALLKLGADPKTMSIEKSTFIKQLQSLGESLTKEEVDKLLRKTNETTLLLTPGIVATDLLAMARADDLDLNR